MAENMEQEFFYWPKKKEVLEIDYSEVDAILNSYYGPCFEYEDDHFWNKEAISWVESQESNNDTCENMDLPDTFDQEEEFEEISRWLENRDPRNVPSCFYMLNELVSLGLLPEGSYLINISW